MQILGSSGLKNSLLASSFSSHLSHAGSLLEFLNFSTSLVLLSYKPVSYLKKNVYVRQLPKALSKDPVVLISQLGPPPSISPESTPGYSPECKSIILHDRHVNSGGAWGGRHAPPKSRKFSCTWKINHYTWNLRR